MATEGQQRQKPGAGPFLGDIGERAAVARVLSRMGVRSPEGGPIVIGPGDDAAVLRLEAGELAVLTTDSLVEGEHFERIWTSPDDLGFKLIESAASDVGAMGGEPRAAVVGVSAPGRLLTRELLDLTDGMLQAARSHNLALIGGDTTRAPVLVLTATVLGGVRPEALRTRGGARPGDRLAVTGPLGDAAAGLLLLRELFAEDGTPAETWLRPASPLVEIEERLAARGWPVGGAESAALTAAVRRFLRPAPPVALGELASSGGATALIDISDGLASELKLISAASGVGVLVNEQTVPVGAGARLLASRRGIDPLALALDGGEDYELLLTVPPSCWETLVSALESVGGSVTAIGEVVRSGAGLRLRDAEGSERPLPAGGFQHFRGS
jgi:thiamine-monophosphate kinase